MQRIQQRVQIICQQIHAVWAGHSLRIAVPAQVWRDHPRHVCQPIDLRLPHAPVERVAVDEEQRAPLSIFAVCH